MANVALSTAGMKIYYYVEGQTPGKPDTLASCTEIPDVVEMPALGDDVNTLDYTPLSAENMHLYIEGLRDAGGAFALTVNDTPGFRTAWGTFVTASESGWASNKKTWIVIVEKGHTDAFYFPGKPVPLGFGGASVDAVLQNIANILPAGDYEFDTAPTT